MSMINVENIHSLSDFQRNTKAHVERLKKTGEAEVLTVNGKAELVVISAEAFQEWSDRIEEAEALEGIRIGLAEMEAGKGRPARVAFDAIRKKHKIPRTP